MNKNVELLRITCNGASADELSKTISFVMSTRLVSPYVIISALRRALTNRAPHPVKPFCPPPRNTYHPALRGPFLTLCGATLASIPLIANADAPETLSWNALLSELEKERAELGRPFTWHTRPGTSSTPPEHRLEFSVSEHTDLYALIVMLSTALQPAAAVRVEDTPTRTVMTFRHARLLMSLSIPRLPPFEALVMVQVEDGDVSPAEAEAVARIYRLSSRQKSDGLLDGKIAVDVGPATVLERRRDGVKAGRRKSDEETAGVEARAKLQELGADVVDVKKGLTWAALAGYEDVKRRIDDTLTLPLRHPEVYEGIVRGTRERYESNLPRAVLYEGPPGCGKTLSARIVASAVGVPFVHVPLEAILSKFYGETTRRLADILTTANRLGRCVVFIDEADSIGMSRDGGSEVHEVTRRTLSVLLRHIDGMDGPQNTIVLAATNHKEAIDPALMSRFDVVVTFPLPDVDTRAAVLGLYAKHLKSEERERLAGMTEGFSGRELLDVCEEAERTHGGRVVRDGKGAPLPDVVEYVEAVRKRAAHVVGKAKKNNRDGGKLLH